MRILLLTHQGDIAGSTNSIAYLAKGLAAKGHEVFVGCREEALLTKLLANTLVQVLPMTFKSKVDRTNIRQIRDAVRQHRIQVINPQSGKDRYTAGFAKWFYDLKVINVHTRRQMPKSSAFFLINKFIVSTTDKIVAVSQPIKAALIRLGLPENHITVIHNGTPPEKYKLPDLPRQKERLQQQYTIGPDEVVVGCVSRRKQQDQLLKAVALLQTPVTVLLVGIEVDDALQEVIDSFTVQHRVIFTGLVPAEEVLYYYSLFTIKVLASDMEGLSQSLLEAMAMGVPVIGTALAGNLDLINHQKNGLLFQEHQYQELAQHISYLLGNEAAREKFIAAGKHTALHVFNIQNTVNNYEKFFEALYASTYDEEK